MGIKRTVEPSTLAVSVAEAKTQCSVAQSNTSFNALFEHFIKSAVNQVQSRCDRSLITQTWQLSLDRFPTWEVWLPSPPLISVSSIQYIDGDGATQTLSSSLYKVSTNSSPGRVTPAYGEIWPTTRNEMEAVEITYTAGYGTSRDDVPEDFRRAILITVDHWFDPDQPMSGATSQGLPGAAISLVENLQSGMKYGAYGVTN